MDIESIRRDLAAFADVGTEVAVGESGGDASFRWTVRGNRAELSVAPDGTVATQTGSFPTYAQFLASAQMADLAGIARAIVATMPSEPAYLDLNAHAEPPLGERLEGCALDLLTRLIVDDSDGRTRLVFVTADAGSGKTTALRELVREQADKYLRGEAEHLYLYVNAQGRALARFNEAMAVELQDLRTSLTYHAVAPLVREGLLVPVVDGFDELIGTQGGYDDAFGSLSLFLEQLDGQGALIAAARSVYYEQEFLSRANVRSSAGAQSWSQWPVRLHRWTSEQVREYSARLLGGDEALIAQVDEVFAPDPVAELRGRPLFVKRVVELVSLGVEIGPGRRFLDSLIDSYLGREQEAKLLSKTGRPLIDSTSLREYYIELALEMWRQETRQLSRSSLREIAELFAGVIGLDGDDQRILVERAPTLAFMASAGPLGAIEFEHETFLLFFLAARIASVWEEGDCTALSQLLSKSDITDELAAYVAERLEVGAVDPVELTSRLQRVVNSAFLRREQISENCGALFVAIIRTFGSSRELTLDGFEFAGVSWAGVDVERLNLRRCRLRRCDMRGARLSACTSEATTFEEPALGSGSRLDIVGLEWNRDVIGISWSSEGGELQVVYEPGAMREALAQAGLPSALSGAEDDPVWAVEEGVGDLLEGLARAYERANPVCETDRAMETLSASPRWKGLLRALLDSGVLTEEARSARGTRKRFFRCHVAPPELVAGRLVSAEVDPRVRDLWSSLAATT